MKRSYSRKPESHQKIARQRITELFSQAEAVMPDDQPLANRYVALARKIGMKYKVRIPSAYRSKHCSHCHAFLHPGLNARVRLQKHKVVIYCPACKHFMRIPYMKKPKSNP